MKNRKIDLPPFTQAELNQWHGLVIDATYDIQPPLEMSTDDVERFLATIAALTPPPPSSSDVERAKALWRWLVEALDESNPASDEDIEKKIALAFAAKGEEATRVERLRHCACEFDEGKLISSCKFHGDQLAAIRAPVAEAP